MSESNVASVDQRFGQRVRATREQLGFAQEHVAALMRSLHGVQWHQTTVAKIEAGTRPVKLSEAVGIAHVLATDLSALVDDGEPRDAHRYLTEFQHRARRTEVQRMARYVELRLLQLDEIETFERSLGDEEEGEEL